MSDFMSDMFNENQVKQFITTIFITFFSCVAMFQAVIHEILLLEDFGHC